MSTHRNFPLILSLALVLAAQKFAIEQPLQINLDNILAITDVKAITETCDAIRCEQRPRSRHSRPKDDQIGIAFSRMV